jgi:hypothetical protein
MFRGAVVGHTFDADVLLHALVRVVRYNKEMLGKHMWKFPAPFLMNAVHFTMQAVASRVILWFQHRGLEPERNAMSWRDYFLRGGYCVVSNLCCLIVIFFLTFSQNKCNGHCIPWCLQL